MEVIHLPRRMFCLRCGLAAERLHETERDCIRAVDAEMKAVMQHARVLTKKRMGLLADWLETIRRTVQPEWESERSTVTPVPVAGTGKRIARKAR